MPPQLHLGINTCFAVKRWPEPEQWISIVREDLHLTCCQLSLDLVESFQDEASTDAYAERVRQLAAGAGLQIHSTFTGLSAYSWSLLLHPEAAMRSAATRWYERVIDFTARLGAEAAGGHIGAFSVRDAADGARREARLFEMLERLRHLSHYADTRGLSYLLFENMAVTREWGHQMSEAHTLVELDTSHGVPFVLCLDIGHPCALHTGTSSDDYLAWLAEPWPRTPIVHLQQTDHTGDHHWPFTGEFNRQGVIQAEAVLQAVEQWTPDTDVYMFLEPIHPFEADDALVLGDLRESVRYWREALAARAVRSTGEP
jgi:D-erythrulose 1-phosphate 3-epimerase